ncbi:succinate dehydrogenase subunit D [Dongia mobilis]|uniref:Succinate dehydrogenase hydrophobic membrane anchor subunit n=1 Tax=Dongia mobilis TaxID=578943 RepID=A0A4V3DEL4_9PROT|nr:succinate dehydrogenase, hydrophobic membrane anchor protein [Dongia mobilis]TDQ82108.1 succinate dehydrogenase subunit D [Dongia mobilis]
MAGRDENALRSHLGRARGLGSAHEGLHHWWAQRLTALALIPLSLWFVASVVCMAGADYAAVSQWLSQPFTVGALSLTILAVFYHAVLGLQVVIEDYIHGKALKLVLLVGLQFAGFGLAAAAIVSLLVIAFAG